jgi:hypothetical protein
MTDIEKSQDCSEIAAAESLMQMALGAVYAWSVFRLPLAKQFHRSIFGEFRRLFASCKQL